MESWKKWIKKCISDAGNKIKEMDGAKYTTKGSLIKMDSLRKVVWRLISIDFIKTMNVKLSYIWEDISDISLYFFNILEEFLAILNLVILRTTSLEMIFLICFKRGNISGSFIFFSHILNWRYYWFLRKMRFLFTECWYIFFFWFIYFTTDFSRSYFFVILRILPIIYLPDRRLIWFCFILFSKVCDKAIHWILIINIFRTKYYLRISWS